MLPLKGHSHTGYHGYCVTCFVFFFLFEVGQSQGTRQAIIAKLLHRRHRDASIKDALPPSREYGVKEKSKLFMQDIFKRYGKNGVMTYEGFEHLLQNLGIGNLHIHDHDIHDHYDDKNEFRTLHEDHDHEPVDRHDHLHNSDEHTDDHNHDHEHDHQNHDHDHEHTNSEQHLNDAHINNEAHQSDEHTNNEQSNNLHNNNVTTTSPSHGTTESHNHSLATSNFTHVPSQTRAPPNQTLSSQLVSESQDTRNKNDTQGQPQHVSKRRTRLKTRRHVGSEVTKAHHIPSDQRHTYSMENHGKEKRDTEQGISDTNSKDSINASTASVSKNQNVSVAEEKKECMSPRQILHSFDMDTSSVISEQMFIYMCPALLVQIDRNSCDRRTPCPDVNEHHHCRNYHGNGDPQRTVGGHHDHAHHDDHGHSHTVANRTLHEAHRILDIPLKVWGGAVLSVLIISLVGLVGVAIVPVMQKVFYTHLLQFFIALAIGSLTGDALLHLLPHALLPHDHGHEGQGHDSHSEGHAHNMEGVWKGLVALSGFFIFFQMERFMAMYADRKRKRKTKPDSPVKNRASHSKREDVGARLCNHNVPSSSCEEMVEVVLDATGVTKLYPDHDMQELQPLDGAPKCHSHGNGLMQDGEGGHGHHHHGHSHVTSEHLSGSVASIAWLVIMGDGLHNFTDGLAIGAAFSNGITGGLSTSVAVFCHELPHELGDFAVLLRAGMSVKQAMIYNIVSSVLCFFGMVIGVCVGNITQATTWVFAFTAGTFIYIALVDMLPELTAVESQSGNMFVQFVVQNIGMLCGMAIMLLIALYEDQIRVTFNIT